MLLKDLLNKHNVDYNNPLIQRALTCASYKKVINQEERRNVSDDEVNTPMATYGDVILKYILTDFLYEKVESITEEKIELEKDEFLVSNIARVLDLVPHLRIDDEDLNIPRDYNYEDDSHKYIATAVEALIAAFHIIKGKNFDLTINFVKDLYVQSELSNYY